ncbi:hypothetical protein [Tunturiibacter lichenicola]|uniref:hypothetical protein n=1 Tax=Tunturiibacter lichenicola TaxID=2051959 RepID=UPI003D9AD9DA
MEITSDSVREIFKGLRATMKFRLAMGEGISRTRWTKASPQGQFPGILKRSAKLNRKGHRK